MYLSLKLLQATKGLTYNTSCIRILTKNLSIILKNSFTTSKKILNATQLNPIGQRAFVSAMVFQIICQYDQTKQTKSMRQLICDRSFFNEFLKYLIGKSPKKAFYDINDFNIEQKYIQEVIGAFQIQKGGLFDPLVWQLNKFSQVNVLNKDIRFDLQTSSDKIRIVLNPQIYIRNIFREIQIQKHPSLIHGQQGIGKSFSYLIYSYLSKFIIQYKLWCMQNDRSPPEELFQIFYWISFQNIKKLIYFNLGKNKTGLNVIKSLINQVPQIDWSFIQWNKADDAKYILNFISQYTHKIIVYFQMLKICIHVRFIVDEANIYFNQCKYCIPILQQQKELLPLYQYNLCQFKQKSTITQNQMNSYSKYLDNGNGSIIQGIKNVLNKKMKDLTIQERMVFNSIFLEGMHACYPSIKLILNSSEQIQDKQVVFWNIYQTMSNQLYCINMQQSGNNLRISYTKSMHNKFHQIQLNHIFWFQIEVNINKTLNYHQFRDFNQQKKGLIIQNLKKVFQEVLYHPSSTKQKYIQASPQQIYKDAQQPFIYWKLDIRHLQIRRFCSDYSFIQWINLFNIEKITDRHINQLKKYIKDLKFKIEKKRFQTIKQFGFRHYIQTSKSPSQRLQRLLLIFIIHRQAVSSHTKAIEKRNKVDSFKMNVNIVSSKKSSKFIQLLQKLPSILNFGYISKDQSQTSLNFYMKDSQIIQLTYFINQISLEQVASLFSLLKDHRFEYFFSENVMDMLYFKAFRSRAFCMAFGNYEIARTTKGYYYQSQTLLIEETFPLAITKESEFQIDLEYLIQKARQNPQRNYCGFPALNLNKYFKSQYQHQQDMEQQRLEKCDILEKEKKDQVQHQPSSKQMFQKIIYHSKNSIFDMAVVTLKVLKNQFIIKLFDLSLKSNMDRVKIQKIQLLLLKYLKESQGKKKIIIQYMFMCPNHYKQKYYKFGSQNKDLFINEDQISQLNKQIFILQQRLKQQFKYKYQKIDLERRLMFMKNKVQLLGQLKNNQLNKYIGVLSDSPQQFIKLKDPLLSNCQRDMNKFLENIFNKCIQENKQRYFL